MDRVFHSAALSAALLVLSASAAFGQSVISAHSGVVNHTIGQVLIDDKAIENKASEFAEVRNNQVLKTEDGRAEILLTPSVFLRVAENSSFRMVSNKLSDTRIEALSGSLILEHGAVVQDNLVTLLYKDRSISFLKPGLYRLDAGDGSFRVYQGEARVVAGDQSLTLKQSHEVQMQGAVLTAMKFDPKTTDEFYRWASRRAEYLAMANVSASKYMHDSGYVPAGGSAVAGMWGYNPWYGAYTYIPVSAMYNSPFGYSFFSPGLISGFYNNYYGGYGYGYYGGGYYPGNTGGGGGTATATHGRLGTAASYSLPSRPASVSAANGGSGRSWGGGGMPAGGGYSGGGYSGGGSSGGSVSSGSSASSGGAGHGGGGGGASGGGGGRGH